MNCERMALSHIRCNDAAEMLGVWMVPDKNRKRLVFVLTYRAVEWGGKVRIGSFLGKMLGQLCVPTPLEN